MKFEEIKKGQSFKFATQFDKILSWFFWSLSKAVLNTKLLDQLITFVKLRVIMSKGWNVSNSNLVEYFHFLFLFLFLFWEKIESWQILIFFHAPSITANCRFNKTFLNVTVA
jgi:hypothetical protein